MLVHARAAADIARQRDRGMIHQPLADAFKAHQNWNAHLLEMPDRTDTGPQEMGRRVDRAAGEPDLAAAELHLLAVDQCLDADAPRTLEQELPDLRLRRDGQVRALARLAVE